MKIVFDDGVLGASGTCLTPTEAKRRLSALLNHVLTIYAVPLRSVLNSYKDLLFLVKKGLIEYTNKVLNTTQEFICNSRPRRFGTSITADVQWCMMDAGAPEATVAYINEHVL